MYLWQPFSISKQSQTQTRNMVQVMQFIMLQRLRQVFYATNGARINDST
jgi:hypothetical protein